MNSCPKCAQQNDESEMKCRACGYQLREPVNGSDSTIVRKRFPIRLVVGLIGCAVLFAYIAYRIITALGALP